MIFDMISYFSSFFITLLSSSKDSENWLYLIYSKYGKIYVV